MPDEDLYRILQVDPEADPEIIQAAFRRLAQKFHPDLAPGPEGAERMKAINRAWSTLRDPAARAAYDLERGERVLPGRTSAAAAAPATRPHPQPPAEGPRPPHGVVGEQASGGPGTPAHGEAGPPPGNPSGSVVNFGRYAGWSLGEIARTDLEYLEWLDRMTIGRTYRAEIDALLRRAGRRGRSAPSDPPHGLPRRR